RGADGPSRGARLSPGVWHHPQPGRCRRGRPERVPHGGPQGRRLRGAGGPRDLDVPRDDERRAQPTARQAPRAGAVERGGRVDRRRFAGIGEVASAPGADGATRAAHPALRGATVTCQEVIAVLADYLEATLSPDLLARIEAHLQDCAACRAYLATYRSTKSLAASAGRVEMPQEMKGRLREFLLRELGEGR